MKRTTIFMPEILERDLQLYARRKGKPAASVVRDAVTEYIARRSTGALPAFAGAFDSGYSDTAERHDEMLFKTLEPHSREAVRRPVAGGTATGRAKAGLRVQRPAHARPLLRKRAQPSHRRG